MPLELSTPSDLQISVKRRFAASPDLVWRGFTDKELIFRWMTGPDGWTMPVCDVDMTVGGKWRFVWAGPDGAQMEARGTYLQISPARHLVHTEFFEGMSKQDTHVETVFEADGDGCVIVQTMTYDSRATRDFILTTPMDQGMESSFARLDRYLQENEVD